jgi:septum formation protein
VPAVEELESGPAYEVAVENAYRKATAVAREMADSLVLGIDTVVSVGPRIHGKPADLAQARAMLVALSGRRHAVISGVCLVARGATKTAVATTLVDFRALDDRLIDWYLDTEEWRDRAGGYAIQGRGAALVAGIEGDYSNVVGLPVTTLLDLIPGLLTGARAAT